MADVQGALTKKIGPLPVWGWAAAGGGLISVLYLSRKGASSSSAAADTGGQQPNVPYVPSPIIVTPGNMPASTSSVNPTAASSTPSLAANQGRLRGPLQSDQWGGVRIWSAPTVDQNRWAGQLPYSSVVTVLGPPIPMPGAPSGYGAPVSWGGGTGYIPTNDLVMGGQGGGMGGAGVGVMNYLPGSGGGSLLRFRGQHAHSQFVATGMGGGGHGRLQAIAHRTGVPVGRLMALNPGQWQQHRRQPGHIHIA